MIPKKTTEISILASCAAIFLYFGLSGLGWGLPSSERTRLVLPQELNNKTFYDLMIERRAAIYSLAGQSSLGRLSGDEAKDMTPVMKSLGASKDGGLEFRGEREILADLTRPYLLRSNSPDEQMILASLAGMNPKALDLNPRLFQYGGAYIYPLGAWLGALSALRIINLTGDLSYYFEKPERMAGVFMAGRWFSLLSGFGSLFILFLLVKKHFGAAPALIASLLYSVTPIIIFEAHIMKPYTQGMLFALIAVYYALEMLDNPAIVRFRILAGVFSGLAMGSMPFYGSIITAPLAALFFSGEKKIRGAAEITVPFLAVFALANPYWLLDIKTLAAELGSSSTGRGSFDPGMMAEYLTRQLPLGTGWAPLLLAAGAAAAGILKKDRKGMTLTLTVLAGLLAGAHFYKLPEISIQAGRIILPWAAAICALSGIFLSRLMRSKKARWAGWLLSAAVFLELFSQTYVVAKNFSIDSGPDSAKLSAGRWIRDNIPAGSKIGIYGLPEPYLMPPMDFSKYRITVVFEPVMPKEADYFICTANIEGLIEESGGFELVKDFRQYDSFMGIRRPMGITVLNAGMLIYKRD